MRVFNLTSHPLAFRQKVIPPSGAFLEFPELDQFVPTRERALEKAKVIAFGTLPADWRPVPVRLRPRPMSPSFTHGPRVHATGGAHAPRGPAPTGPVQDPVQGATGPSLPPQDRPNRRR